jgi:hypothetical protein
MPDLLSAPLLGDRFGPYIRLGAGDLGDQVHVGRGGRGEGLALQGRRIEVLGREDAAQRAKLPQVARQSARVDVGQGHNVVLAQVLDQRLPRAPVALSPARLAHDQGPQVGLRRFGVLVIDPSVANVRVGHHHHLPPVGGIGEDFLIAGHPGVKHHLADPLPYRAKGPPAKGGAVFQDQ